MERGNHKIIGKQFQGDREQGGFPALQHRQEIVPRRQARRHAALPRPHQHPRRVHPLLAEGGQGGAGHPIQGWKKV